MRSRLPWRTVAVAALAALLLTAGSELFFRFSESTVVKGLALLLLLGGSISLGWPGSRGASELPACAAFLVFLAYLAHAATRFPGLLKAPGGATPLEILRWSGLIGGAVLVSALLSRAGLLGLRAISRPPDRDGG